MVGEAGDPGEPGVSIPGPVSSLVSLGWVVYVHKPGELQERIERERWNKEGGE